MSVRTIPALAVAVRAARPVRAVPRARGHVHTASSAVWESFADRDRLLFEDDTQLIGLKLLLLGGVLVLLMLLEVPL